MHPLRVGFVIVSQLIALAVAIYSAQSGGVKVQILLYAFVIDFVLRIVTVRTLHDELKKPDVSWIASAARFISRLPHRHEKPQPLQQSRYGPPAHLPMYLGLTAFLGLMAFMISNTGADEQYRPPPADVVEDLSWAMTIAGVYWVNSLLNRLIVVDPRKPLPINYGYNTREIQLLAPAVLMGAAVFAVRKFMGLGPTAWTVMGPLLGLRFVFDLRASLKAPR